MAGEVFTLPHMFSLALINISFPLSQAKLAGKGLSDGPLRSVQHWITENNVCTEWHGVMLNRTEFHINRKVLSLPHMFWSVLIGKRIFLISSDQNQNSSFPSHFGWKLTQQWPHSALLSLISIAQPDQHWSECPALKELNSAECLKAEQNWTELTDTEQCWVMLHKTKCYISITAVVIIIITSKCMNRDWTMASIDIM